MISIIICSRHHDISSALKDNISETIGINYELIVIDNSRNEFSIFSAYNEGVRRAKYPYLCFMHEDIMFHTQDWGKKTIDHFQDPQVGIIGVIGGHYLPNTIAYWHDINPYYLSGVVPIQDNQKFEYLDYVKPQEHSVEVVVVDGMWFCIPKNAFDNIRFDDTSYNGFHMYDMDICMQVMILWHKQVKVVFNISVGHYTSANINETFLTNLRVFYQKWQTFLPIHKGVTLDEKLCNFIQWRMQEYYNLFDSYFTLKKRFDSKAYRLGKWLLKLFLLIQKK